MLTLNSSTEENKTKTGLMMINMAENHYYVLNWNRMASSSKCDLS